MPGKVKVKIVSGRNLPVMDRSSDTTDAYVEIKLGTTTYKTDVCRKSLHPQWNSEWYRFEVDDSELQDEPLQIRLMDHDTYSANDAIGKVYLDLNPLLLPTASAAMKWNEGDNPTNSVMSGWIPVYDTMHGIRGEVNVIVKVELFSDFNKFRQSSCGVPFFCSPTIPHGFYAQVVHGFVEELVVNDDPEYQWIDKIRTPRASNEARQTLFFKLSGELQRKIGVKALDLGGNAVVGYNQSFDLEGESGIVARGIGTAVSLIKIIDAPNAQTTDPNAIEERTQSYLKFLGSAKGFYLNSTSNQFIRKSDPKPLPSPSLSIRSLRLDDIIFKSDFNSQHMTRHLSDREFNEILRPPTELIHHSTSLQTLLKQEDMRGMPSYGISRKFKNLKYSSQSMLSKKMTALKAKLSDDSDDKIRNFIKYRRTQSDSTGMAEILVRSVFNATSSLDCIAEAPHCTKPDEETLEVSYLSLPDASTETRSSNASSTSSDTSSLDEDDNKDDELDTVSDIVEAVRKLSMAPIALGNTLIIDNIDDDLMDISEEEKLLFVVGDDDSPSDGEGKLITPDTSLMGTTVQTDLDNANIEGALKSPGATSESFFPQFAQTFKAMKKTATALSLSEMDSNTQRLGGTKFTSLHDIHGECSKVNKYSAHEGKMTVLGELFHRVDNGHHVDAHNLDSPSHRMYEFFKDGKDKIVHGYHRLDNKMHHKKDDSPPGNNSEIKHSHGLLGTALGNVLMDSVNEILVTSHIDKQPGNKQSNDSSTSSTTPTTPTSPDSFLGNFRSVPSGSISISPPASPSSPKSKRDLKNKIFTAPKVLYKRLDSKIHHKKNGSGIKNPDGLLNTALGNVLMDSVNEVLVTSHTTDIPQSQPHTPEPKPTEPPKSFFKDSKKLFKGPKVLFKRLQHKKSSSNDDLVTTALGNVLMDSVKEMLATSSKSNDPKTPAPLEVKTANQAPSVSPSLPVKPVNTEIETGNSVSINNLHACLTPSLRDKEAPPVELRVEIAAQQSMEPMGTRMPHMPTNLNSIPYIHRRSSDSDLSITPKGNSLTGSDRSAGCASGQFLRGAMIRSTIPQENFDILEYPFLTLSKYPAGFITYLGGAVSSRSVKLLERITNIEEPESRDTWWSEIRMEIRSHARALNCNAVLGYTEAATICDEVCVLSASGTAAIIGCQYSGEDNDNLGGLPIIPKVVNNKDMMTTSLDRNDFEKEKPAKIETVKSSLDSPEMEPIVRQPCCVCHLPYMGNSVPSRQSPSKCCICRYLENLKGCDCKGKVPDILIATIEMPEAIPSLGRGCFVQSYVCRPMRDSKGEAYAKELSEGLPFLEYELHRLLINKLRVKGMNAVFGLKVRVSIGERMIVGIASGTAVYLTPLPAPPLPKLRSDRTTDEKKLAQLQKSLQETVRKNKEIYQLILTEENGKSLSDTDDSDEDLPALDLRNGNKDCCILEVDDPEDVDVLNSLMEPRPPDGFHVVNTELVPGLEDLEIVKNLQMFTQIWRAKISPPYGLDKHFHRLLQSVYFKLRRMIPCALCDLQFRVDSPEPDEIQLCVLGMALGLGEPQKSVKSKRKNLLPKRADDDLIFNLEDDQIPEHSVVATAATGHLHTQSLKYRQKSPLRNRLRQRHVPYKERHGVDITPLSYVPGGKIEKYLGNLNFFFIRETTSLREEGGLSGFIHSFVTEILAIVRAHVTALGGNAMVAYFINECVLNHNLHKNQGQCLVNVGGDVVHVTYENT